ncbi:Hypothetical predicted protein [Prunus dulcis]|uniref:Protein kinase superfamily protein n=1 Tax=Prunus dulcis TaxID=3755 RepID=A0A5E4E967_PRUDU|nr:hypothetical protein L3X38_014133 [Prunus dulcis]VVA12353.1 Hypothetical predicted protein [Prunus dulcis]
MPVFFPGYASIQLILWDYWVVILRLLRDIADQSKASNPGNIGTCLNLPGNYIKEHDSSENFTGFQYKLLCFAGWTAFETLHSPENIRNHCYGENGKVYKGILPDERVVAVKKFKSEESTRYKFVKDVRFLSPMIGSTTGMW